MSTAKLVASLKDAGQDHEFYPTTDEIIAALVRDIAKAKDDDHRSFSRIDSALDIGAGNGKVLRALREKADVRDLYAIEKSLLLCRQMDADIFIVGTEFTEQSLLSKRMGLIFCNPPYSAFEDWAVKIIREASAPLAYLVIPVRWKDSVRIADALKFRDAETTVAGTFSFEDSEDRTARAKVNLLRIMFHGEEDDAFNRFFEEQFGGLKAKFEQDQKQGEDEEDFLRRHREQEADRRFQSLVVGDDYPDRLVALYNEEMATVQKNYQLVAELDVELLREFDVTPPRILKCLKERLSGLRTAYWKELFSKMKAVTDRLTAKKRDVLLTKLNSSGHVDFTPENILAVVVWALKNANTYLEEQLLDVFERMVDKANVRNYKSNRRPLVENRWRYMEEKPTHIALEFRLVLERIGGIRKKEFFGGGGLEERAGEFLQDLMTVARNLGFECNTQDPRVGYHGRDQWSSGQVHEFYCTAEGRRVPLAEVRAFLNGNMHVRLNQQFALALNVEYGRLKGWLASAREAAEELGDPEAAKYYATHHRLGAHSFPALAAHMEGGAA